MWAVHCEQLERRVLVHASSVRGIVNLGGRILVDYRCWCGADGRLVTGKGVHDEQSGHLREAGLGLPISC